MMPRLTQNLVRGDPALQHCMQESLRLAALRERPCQRNKLRRTAVEHNGSEVEVWHHFRFKLLQSDGTEPVVSV